MPRKKVVVQQTEGPVPVDVKFFDSSKTVHENLPNTDTPMTGGPYDPTARVAEETPPMQPQPIVEGE